MTDFRELYQEMILDHNHSPRNRRRIESADRRAEGFNPLCGDRVTVYLKLDGDRIVDVAFEGSGCAISTASASMMTQVLRGQTLGEAKALFDRFHELLTRGPRGDNTAESLGKLAVFSGVSEFPARVKCATLVWHTVNEAIQGGRVVVSTE